MFSEARGRVFRESLPQGCSFPNLGRCRRRCEELKRWDLTTVAQCVLAADSWYAVSISAVATKIRKQNSGIGFSRRSRNVAIAQWSRAAGWSMTTKLAVGIGLAAAAIMVMKVVKAK